MTTEQSQHAREQLQAHAGDDRFQHELQEMEGTDDLRRIDDDVEAAATLLEWHAPEHVHQPKSVWWMTGFVLLGAVFVGLLVWMGNYMGALTILLIAGTLYIIAKREPRVVRYRIMVDGVAIGETLYHFRDLDLFNIVYEPGETKVVLIRSKRKLTPLITMEVGDADPVAIRDVLMEFVQEDQDLQEPIVDIFARRLGV